MPFDSREERVHKERVPGTCWARGGVTLLLSFNETSCSHGSFVMNCDACVTCHTHHTFVTDFRPKSGNPVEVTLITSPKLYIVSHTKGTTSLSFNINHDTLVLSLFV